MWLYYLAGGLESLGSVLAGQFRSFPSWDLVWEVWCRQSIFMYFWWWISVVNCFRLHLWEAEASATDLTSVTTVTTWQRCCGVMIAMFRTELFCDDYCLRTSWQHWMFLVGTKSFVYKENNPVKSMFLKQPIFQSLSIHCSYQHSKLSEIGPIK